jgi:hypothetical protein
MAILSLIDAVVLNFEHGTLTLEEHERAWRNVLASSLQRG